LDGTC